MSKKEEIPTAIRTRMTPNPSTSHDSKWDRRVSIASSIASNDSVGANGDTVNHRKGLENKSKVRRCRKRLSTLLHTHVALILVCTLAALDAACVIGQIICDILIMKETLHEWEVLDENLTSILWKELPILNESYKDSASLNLHKIRNFLLDHQQHHPINLTALTSQLAATGFTVPLTGLDPHWLHDLEKAAASARLHGQQAASSVNVSIPVAHDDNENITKEMFVCFFKIPVSHNRRRRAAAGDDGGGHDMLHDLTHSFHLGSLIILSLLLLETLLKVFAMGKKILHHKLEIFDAFVVSVSWALDVAFWEGIWAHPGTEAATILIFILPWRVVRIVNSFVLVIQEKDHVQLKIVKQRLRLSVKKTKESTRKASSYRTEVKQLQGLCRKYGATENEIGACGPTRHSGRRRSSLMPAMERAASLTLISALGSHPSLYTMDSSSDEESMARHGDLSRTTSHDPTLRSAYSVTTLDSVFTIEGKSEGQRDGYITSDNETETEFPSKDQDNAAFDMSDEVDPPTEESGETMEDAETGPDHIVRHIHQGLSEQPSISSVVSETSTSGSSGAGSADQEVPPHYHEVVCKQDSNTRL